MADDEDDFSSVFLFSEHPLKQLPLWRHHENVNMQWGKWVVFFSKVQLTVISKVTEETIASKSEQESYRVHESLVWKLYTIEQLFPLSFVGLAERLNNVNKRQSKRAFIAASTASEVLSSIPWNESIF